MKNKVTFWTIAIIILFIRIGMIASEETANIMQQTLQSVQWLGFGLLAIVILLLAMYLKE